MSKLKEQPLGRVTITLPAKLLEQMEVRIEAGMYAGVSEWIRHAIREQLQREQTPLERLLAEEPRLEASLAQASRGETSPLDLSKLKRS
jgi:Arc/MetJ-type ribon-helix-helix transcriptional regulator